MIKYVNDREILRFSLVTIRSHSSATSKDFIDYVRSIAQKKQSKVVVIYSGTNNIANKVNTS